MESLKNFQIQLNGGIEREYFRKNPFNEYKSEYFSSERQFHLTSELEEMIANHKQQEIQITINNIKNKQVP